MKYSSDALLTSPLRPTKQCSVILVKTEPSSYIFVNALFFLFVLHQTTSSHLLNPHFLNKLLASSKWSAPHHKNKKVGVLDNFSIGIFAIYSISQGTNWLSSRFIIPWVLFAYSFHGGSIKITSNYPN